MHGYLASFNRVYEGVINHFTRTGNIVVMATYGTDLADVQGSADRALQALTAAVPQLEREDLIQRRADRPLARRGHAAVGHPAGRVPGLGNRRTVAVLAGALPGHRHRGHHVPAHTRAVIEAYDGTGWSNRSVGVDLFRRLSMPGSQKDHITVRTSSHGGATLTAQHTSPNSVISPDDAIKFYGIYRVGDLLESCALLGGTAAPT